MHTTEAAPLAGHTTLGVGGPAGLLVEVAGATAEVRAALDAAHAHAERPVTLLGEGSNVVVSDRGLDAVLLLRGGTVRAVGRTAGGTRVRADGGMVWDDLVAWAVAQGLGGIELLSGIPGTVGAAPVQNIAAYGQALADTFVELEAVDRATGEVVQLSAADCAFGYRDSRFKRDWADRFVITSVTLDLVHEERSALTYRDLEVHFERHGGDPWVLADRRAAVLAVRRAKSMVWDPQDALTRSCGSFFMSPFLPRDEAIALVDAVRGRGAGERLFAWYSGAEAEDVKVPAAMVLLAAGFANGDRWGQVGLSPRHVLAIVNLGGATAQRVSDVAAHIQAVVWEQLGVRLHAEPRFLGEFDPFDARRFAEEAPYTPGDADTPGWARDAVR
ncbi:UDP-N-acetylmuramate dehydrogenase [Egibacter rhizosphaerae]|uniref:UDP-N-acetylenolpyruvoylglucosamine reductase n=1 Tax=Egibacter rhizosphaerae TaxID=1670831 RepID=A0A411YBY5_9ACTN|nr:UDP-N-acetylmuramate dehydrogenase [Egibacter rhizosphaerae]QBI18672.1 UDP-N-acetylmuramate dehydrogenase [Egibacter rhizosphaerae]